MPTIRSNFKTGTEDWTTVGGATDIESFPESPDSTGYVRGTDSASGVWAFQGGSEWVGDLSDQFGGTLKYSLRQDDDSSQFADEDVTILGVNGVSITYTFGFSPGTDFTSFSVRLDAFSSWRIDGSSGRIASAEEILSVLEDVASFQIRGEYKNGADGADLNSVSLTEGKIINGDDVSIERPDFIKSTFNKGGEGWGFINDVREFRTPASGGVNDSGYLEVVDQASGAVMYYVAPQEYLDSKGGFYGGKLSYSMTLNDTSSPFTAADVIISGANGNTMHFTGDISPNTEWNNFSVRLSIASDWRLGSDSGTVATKAEIQAILDDILAMEIRGEFRVGGETVGMDNVILKAKQLDFDLYESATDKTLLDTSNGFDKLMQEATTGNAISIKYDFSTHGSIEEDITVNRMTVMGTNAAHAFSGKLALKGVAHNFTAQNFDDLTITGSNIRDTIKAQHLNAAFLKILGGGGNDKIIGEAFSTVLKGGDRSGQHYRRAWRRQACRRGRQRQTEWLRGQ
ncbi:MAG: hypothetical protein KUG74_02860 [Rhodobacteraceae bacterium]|nr:hypothetical protein [Paracoccaceae bacterium]